VTLRARWVTLRAPCASRALQVGTLLLQLYTELHDPTVAPTLPVGEPSDPPLARWLAFWVPPLVHTLTGPDVRMRAMAACHVLPLPLKQHPAEALAALLGALLARAAAAAPADAADVAAALVAALKGARALNLLVALEHTVTVGDRCFVLPAALLETAVVHAQEAVRCVARPPAHSSASQRHSLLRDARWSSGGGGAYTPTDVRGTAGGRLDALELCCLSVRKAQAPNALELRLLRRAVPAMMRVGNTGVRNKIIAFMCKFLARLHHSTTLIHNRQSLRQRHELSAGTQWHEQVRDSALSLSLSLLAHHGASDTAVGSLTRVRGAVRTAQAKSYSKLRDAADPEAEAETLAASEAFAQWLVRYLLASLYPGAPYERKQMAVDLLLACGTQWYASLLNPVA
jgi:hypothetical protein